MSLYEFLNRKTGERVYTTKSSLRRKGFVRSRAPLYRVWPNPMTFDPFDGE